MKKIKKLAALVLVAAMVLAMNLTAFAAETTEQTSVALTVNNAEGAKVTIAQIVKANRESTIGWAYTDAAYADIISLEALIKLTGVSGDDEKMTTDATLAEVAEKFSKSATAEFDGKNLTAGGLYVVKVEKKDWVYAPMLIYVPVDSKEKIVLNAKGSSIIIKKDVTENTGSEYVYSGEKVSYTVEVAYPFFGANKGETFRITDTLENADYVDDSVKVTIGGATPDEGTVTTVIATPESEKDIQTLTVDFAYNTDLAGQKVVITYDAIVKTFTKVETVNNDVKIDEVMADADHTVVKELSASKVVTPTAGVDFVKKSADDESVLEGAKFDLYVYEGEALTAPAKELPAGAKKVASAVSDKDGKVSFVGLDVTKNYCVVETEAPVGFKLNTTVYPVAGATAADKPEVSIEVVDDVTVTTTTYKIVDGYAVNNGEVLNTVLSQLPFTGGMGTTLFTVLGVAIMVMAAGLYFATKKRA